VEVAAAELGLILPTCGFGSGKLNARNKPVKALGGMAQLRAENEALRNQITHLQVQWDILKTTWGCFPRQFVPATLPRVEWRGAKGGVVWRVGCRNAFPNNLPINSLLVRNVPTTTQGFVEFNRSQQLV
jgi:hypothetical protein